MLVPLNVRIEKNLLKDFERFVRTQNLDKAAFLRAILRKGFEQAKQEMVLMLYERKQISFGMACQRLKINGWEFLELLKAQHAHLNVDLEDLLDASPLPSIEIP